MGIGYRNELRSFYADHGDEIEWFELIADRYFSALPESSDWLVEFRQTNRLVAHGLDLSLGTDAGLDPEYSRQAAELCRLVRAPFYSDHLCMTHAGGVQLGHLTPLPFTRRAAHRVADKAKAVQDLLGVPLILENIAYSFALPGEMPEVDFVASVVEEADCGILLDLTNLFVNSQNHGYDPYEFLRRLPLDRVVQVHLAGSERHKNKWVDSHSQSVEAHPEVWALLEAVVRHSSVRAVLLERDQNFPEDPGELSADLRKARAIFRGARANEVANEVDVKLDLDAAVGARANEVDVKLDLDAAVGARPGPPPAPPRREVAELWASPSLAAASSTAASPATASPAAASPAAASPAAASPATASPAAASPATSGAAPGAPLSTDALAFQSVLARVLVDRDLRRQLANDAREFGHAMGLDAGAIHSLQVAGLDELEDFASSLENKRFGLVSRSSPALYKRLEQAGAVGHVHQQFVRRCPPTEAPEYPNRTIRDAFWAQQLVRTLLAEGDATLARIEHLDDIAHFEHLVLGLAMDRARVESARQFQAQREIWAALPGDAVLRSFPRLGSHVTIEWFACVVTAVVRAVTDGEPVPPDARRRARVLIVKQPGAKNVKYFELNALTDRLLGLCDGRRTGGEIADALARLVPRFGSRFAGTAYRDKTAAILGQLVQQNVLALAPAILA
ncbi:MAG TPA: DUF692 domain-containing protein [Kofleriaceae bacterium]|nr:DUF692 domain-containing protein [Kofleriaceae bacterium]